MINKIILFSIMAWLVLAVSSTRAAKATMDLGGLKGVTEVTFTPKYKQELNTLCGHTFNYLQFVTVAGVGSVWVYVEAIYPAGRENVVSQERCENGDYLYVLERCGC